MNLVQLLHHNLPPLFLDDELPQDPEITSSYITSSLDDIIYITHQFDPSQHTKQLITTLAQLVPAQRNNGYLVGLGHIKEDFNKPYREREDLIFRNTDNSDVKLTYNRAHFTNQRLIRPGREDLLSYINETGHDGLHLWNSQPGHGLLRSGGTAEFDKNGYDIRGLTHAAADALADKGGKGSTAAAKYAAATQKPTLYLRDRQHSHNHFLFFEPFANDGERGARTHIVNLNVGPNPQRRRAYESSDIITLPIAQAYGVNPSTPHLYAA